MVPRKSAWTARQTKPTIKYIPELVKRAVRKTFAHNLYLRTQLLNPLPYAINIELTTKCNLSCTMCARHKIAGLDGGDMDFELFKKIIDQIRPFTRWNTSLTLVGLGEPLMYDRLEDALAYAKMIYPHVPINLSTNGLLLDSERSYALTRLMGQGDCICVSLNAHDRDTYKWLMGADKYNVVAHNIKQFLQIRERSKSGQKLKLVIQIMRTKKTPDTEIQQFRKFWASFITSDDEISVKSILNWGGKIDVGNFLLPRQKTKRHPCLELWISIAIDKDGNVYPCCEGFSSRGDSQLIMGNISQRPLSLIYSHRIDNFRSVHLRDDYQMLPECANCDFYTAYPNVWIRNKLVPVARKWI